MNIYFKLVFYGLALHLNTQAWAIESGTSQSFSWKFEIGSKKLIIDYTEKDDYAPIKKVEDLYQQFSEIDSIDFRCHEDLDVNEACSLLAPSTKKVSFLNYGRIYSGEKNYNVSLDYRAYENLGAITVEKGNISNSIPSFLQILLSAPFQSLEINSYLPTTSFAVDKENRIVFIHFNKDYTFKEYAISAKEFSEKEFQLPLHIRKTIFEIHQEIQKTKENEIGRSI